ncbi:ABC transporter substrate-binding protein [Parapedobacter koreensis]|uniref:Iron complex transport system substrate-binding protein n=1 Tax=Parapedobacter koreensis TaxID=332977 RepID=A0A1H7REH9_9SPHI|nr:hypothetical protein [Parapedobacter koreensis]SEL58651.1 iron complex transport system substrate-binding protein [Parapedobacter koreensis]
MQSPFLSLHSVLEALQLDVACIPLLEQAPLYDELVRANTPQAVFSAIRTIGDVLNAQQPANQLAESLEDRINIIIHKLKFIADENKPKVLILHDVSPMQVATDEYLANLIQTAGGINYHTDTPLVTWNPDVIIIINDKPMSQLLDELPKVFSDSIWASVNAIANNNVYIIHHRDYLRRPGALIADDTEILAEICYPKYFVFGRDEDAWMKFEW